VTINLNDVKVKIKCAVHGLWYVYIGYGSIFAAKYTYGPCIE